MNSHYCDIFSDCYRCPAPYCPYEKRDEAAEKEEKGDEEEEEG